MADYEVNLRNLQSRRSVPGHSKTAFVFDSASVDVGLESYQELSESAAIKYAIGAMQPVATRYTEISFEEGKRVADSLINSLSKIDCQATYEFQGSVPLDIHIKGVSDVDVLIFHPYFTTQKPVLDSSRYTTISDGLSMLDRIKQLRLRSETILVDNFPAVDVNTTKPKAINLNGGSLQREIDIVPAHWHDSHDYQRSKEIRDREVNIYDKSDNKTLGNSPFKHMATINDLDSSYGGNLKKVCRLLKNIKADAPENVQESMKYLSSYDIAGLVYNMSSSLACPQYYELGLVANTYQYLLRISRNNYSEGRLLITPDGSRKVLNEQQKIDALLTLTIELASLYQSLIAGFNIFENEAMALNRMREKMIYT